VGSADEVDRLIEQSSLGSAKARELRARTDPSRIGSVLQLAELRARFEAATDAAEMTAAAIKLAGHLCDLSRGDAAKVALAEAIDRLDKSNIDHRRPIAELKRAAGEADEASVWFEQAADAGDPRAFDDELAILWERELPPAGVRSREALRELPSPSRELVAATTFLGMNLPRAATLMGIGVEAAEEHELSGLHTLNYRLDGGRWRPGMEPVDPSVHGLAVDDLNIGGVVRSGGFDENFEDPSSMPGQVIGGTLTNDERSMIQLMDPKDRARYLLQKRIQEKAEMAVLLSRLQTIRHQTAMSVINNIR
jgi:hypothetical protein